jgi:hypothetical protein
MVLDDLALVGQWAMAKPREFVGGAVAGLIATAPVTLVMEWLHRQLPAHQQRSFWSRTSRLSPPPHRTASTDE